MGYTAISPGVVEVQKADLIWEWNGIDTSQFGTPQIFSTSGANVGTLAANITTDTGTASPHPGGVRLFLETTGSVVSGKHFVVFPIIQELPTSYEVVVNSDVTSAASTTTLGWGTFIWGDLSGNGHGYCWHNKGARSRLDDGVLSEGTLNNPGLTDQGQIIIRVEGRPGAFVDYAHGQLLVESKNLGGSEFLQVTRNAYNANDGDWNIPAGLPPASWIGTQGNRFGLALYTELSSINWFINSIKIKAI